jgi:Icc-related predicted phosphoesterase
MVDYLNLMYSETPPWMKVIVVGHHAPSKASTHPRYRGETIVNGAYSSDLSEFILDRPGIKLWTHGHTHEDFDYMIGDCRVVCNPRGYDGYERRAAFFELKVIDV